MSTETEVKAYMEATLGNTASKINMSVAGGDFDEAYTETTYYFTDIDVSWVSEKRKVRMVARIEAWRAVMFSTVHEASFSAGMPGTGQTNRADIHRQAKAMYQMALNEFNVTYPDDALMNVSTIKRTTLNYHDPYENSASTDDEWSRVN